MNLMIRPLLRNELAKALRRKLTWLGIAAAAAVCVLFYLAARHLGAREMFSGWSFVQYAVQTSIANVGLFFVAIFSAALIAEERGSGTIRIVLSGPLRRWEFFAAKAGMGLLYATALMLVALGCAIGLALLRTSFGDVTDDAGVVYPFRQVLANFLLAAALDWLTLWPVVFYGLFISAIARNAGHAIGTAIGVLVLLETAKSVLGFKPYVFTTYVGSSWGIFQQVAQGLDYMWQPEIWKILLVPIVYSVVFLAAGLVVLVRKDLNG